MQMGQDGVHHGPVSILFIPMMDKKSANRVCILSTISFICSLAKKNGKAMELQRTRAHIFLYGTLIGLIISKVFALKRETIFQSEICLSVYNT